MQMKQPMINLKIRPPCMIILFGILCFPGFSQTKQHEELKEPVVINPGKKCNAPSDAIILFDKGSLDMFESDTEEGGVAPWKVSGRKFTVVPGAGSIRTKEIFGDMQLHIEWRTPKSDVKEGKEKQKSGNSGVNIMGRYEVQILNSYINKTYFDGQAGAIYRQYPPLVNASRKPGKWQSYDIIFKAPRFSVDGSLEKPGYCTVFHNGVLIQDHAELKGSTGSKRSMPVPKYTKHNPEEPFQLQNHKSEVSYRNIWVRKL